MALTVPECFGMYLAAVIDQQNAERPKDDPRLAPHLEAEEHDRQADLLAQAQAYSRLTPRQRLEVGIRMHGG